MLGYLRAAIGTLVLMALPGTGAGVASGAPFILLAKLVNPMMENSHVRTCL